MGFSQKGNGLGSVMKADNVSFDGTDQGGVLTTNGQLLVGSTATPHIKVGSLTSPNGTITIGYSSPNITLELQGGQEAIDGIIPNSGTSPVTPNIAGNVSIIGTGSITAVGSLNTETIQLTGLTNHTVLVGAGTATITKVGPGSAGQVLQSGGASADPAYSTATYPLTSTANQLLYSSATNTITGLATVNSGILATNSSGIPSITTASGNWNNTSRTCFSAHLGSNVTNATGAGATWKLGTTTALTIDFDQGSNFNSNGTFTAPVAGKYFFQGYANITNCTLATIFLGRIIASGNNYDFQWTRAASSADGTVSSSCIVSMAVNDTATFNVNTQGEVGNTDTILGSTSTRFSGYLIC